MKIKLFFNPEYSATSLWNEKGENLPYEYVPLSIELVKQLEDFDESIWSFVSDSNMTEQRKREIYENGLRLYNLVALELGAKYEVVERLDWIKP